MYCMQTMGSIRNTGITLQILFQSRSSRTQPHQTHIIFLFTNAFRHLIIACGTFTRGCALEQILCPYALEQSPVPPLLQPKVAWVLGKSSVLLSLGGWMYSLPYIRTTVFFIINVSMRSLLPNATSSFNNIRFSELLISAPRQYFVSVCPYLQHEICLLFLLLGKSHFFICCHRCSAWPDFTFSQALPAWEFWLLFSMGT